MDFKIKRFSWLTAVVLALAIGQMCLPVSFAAPQQASAALTTASNKPIMVNGVTAVSGATILTGAMIETPDEVGAAMTIPGHFSLDISPNSKLSVEFELNNIKVNVSKGCVVLHITKGTTGELQTPGGAVQRADGSKDETLSNCDPKVAAAPAAPGALGGLSGAATWGLIAAIGGSMIIIPILLQGDNPSPSS